MAQCKLCGRSGLFLKITVNGLCNNCEPVVAMEVTSRIRVLKDSVVLAEKGKTLDTRLSRCDTVIEYALALMKYEKLGIKTTDPFPSTLAYEYQMKRKEIVTQGLIDEAQKTMEKVKIATSPKAKIKLLSKLLMLIREYKGRIPADSQVDELEKYVHATISQIQLDENLEETSKAEFKGNKKKALDQYSALHLLFLSKFLSPKGESDFEKTDDWATVLGEGPRQAIKRFVDEGLLTLASVEGKLDYTYKATELKAMLKERGLPTSGKKADYIRGLIQSHTSEMQKITQRVNVFSCTDKGREIAEQYIDRERALRKRTEQEVMEYLRQHKFREASIAVASFEAGQVFPRGIGIDWKHNNPSRDVEMLHTIFTSKPKILASLDDVKMSSLRLAASMMELWGTNRAKEWLPNDFETGLPMDGDVAASMFSFFASHKWNVENYRRNGDVVIGVEILPAPNACPECKKLSGKRFKLDEVLELPYEHCTSNMGCRCCLLPVVIGEWISKP